MRRRFSWQLVLGITLIALSALVYLIHYLIFRDAHHIFIYMIGDVAFVFVEVLMVTLIIQEALSRREKRAIMEKLNIHNRTELVRFAIRMGLVDVGV